MSPPLRSKASPQDVSNHQWPSQFHSCLPLKSPLSRIMTLTSFIAQPSLSFRRSSDHRIPLANVPRRPKPNSHVFYSCADAPSDDFSPFERLFLKGPVPGDKMVRTISANGEVSCRVVLCTGLVQGATRLHRTTPVASTAFGRSLVCALLLSAGKKDGETLQIEFRGSGPINGITAISNGLGEVRGYLGNPFVQLPLRGGRVDVSAAIGSGILAVVRTGVFNKQPYTGLVQISSGEVAEDIARYLRDSEQTPSALGAGIYIAPDGSVTAAGGFLVQLLPGASERSADIVERNVRAAGAPTDLIRSGKSPEEIVDDLMKDLLPMKVASVSPRYACQCGVERVKRTVTLIPPSEVREVLRDHGKIEATCEFCGQVYSLLPDEVERLLRSQKP